MLEFGIADETAWRAGLSCGGRIRVYVESLDANQAALLAAFNAERAARNPCVLITHVTSGEQRLVRAADIAADPMADVLEERLRLGKSGMAVWGGEEFFLTCLLYTSRCV